MRPTLKSDKLYGESDLLDLLGMEPEETPLLAEWRKNGVGPEYTTLPDGRVRYFGFSILAMTYPEAGMFSLGDDPRAFFAAQAQTEGAA